MAYRPRRRSSARKTGARSSYGTRGRASRTRVSARRNTGKRSAPARQQTIKIVVETLPQSAVARPAEPGRLQAIQSPPRQSKF